MNEARPLAGLKVLELGALIAGPFCAKILAEFGADVIKIEPPGQGDPLRKWRYVKDGTSVWWHVQSRGKKSIALDLRKPEGQAIARKLALAADIVVENFRPGTMEEWGMGYDALAAANPGLVMVRISGYGQTGPYRERPGFGVIGEAMGGLRHVTGTPDRPPSRTGISIGDTLSALYGVIGAMMALESRRKTGRGQVVDVALYESVFSVMESLLPEFDAKYPMLSRREVIDFMVRDPGNTSSICACACSPFAARKTSKPAWRRLMSISSAIAASSSTTSTRLIETSARGPGQRTAFSTCSIGECRTSVPLTI